ncbi:hypothetical protein A2U01_0083679, partial [Trifolium medium]|nr:hypothetical protein [Trifolium medium]
MLVGDVINLEKELFPSISARAILVQPERVEDVHAIELAKKIVGSWSDAVTELDYIQDPPSWCGTTSSDIT